MLLAALLVVPLATLAPSGTASLLVADSSTTRRPDAAARATAAEPFDARAMLALAPGALLPRAFDEVGGKGLRLVRRAPVPAIDGLVGAEHFVFEHPLAPAREASILVRGGRLHGMITTGGARLEIRARDGQIVCASLAAPASELSCGTTPDMHAPGAVTEGGLAGVDCDDGSRIDVFVGYTDAARAQAGGAQQLADAILWAVGDSTAIYAHSGIAVTLRLVGTQLAEGYVEDSASMANDLYALQDPANGALDGVHAAGVAAGADLIALVRADGGGACGIAFLVGGSVDQVAYGVSVTALGCFSNRTFTHELGHNMGCCHAPGDGGGCLSGGVYPYSTGHRFTGSSGSTFRTVMAYAPGTRIGRFSSPLVSFEGTPTGIADERDNARTINETRAFVANFRCEVCLGDANLDGMVDGADLSAMLNAWGSAGGSADLNGDGTVDAADLAVLLGNWGACN